MLKLDPASRRDRLIRELRGQRADARRIKQVMFNLVSNSLRFTESGGEVVVSAQRAGDQ